MYTTALLTTLLAAITIPSTLGSSIPSASTSTSPTPNTTTTLFHDPKRCPMTHYPTESQYRLAVRQHCTKHFPSTGARRIPHAEKLVYTYVLTDYRGYPIRWILSTNYLAGDIRTGSLEATRKDCFDRFNAFIDGGTGIGDKGGEGKTWCQVDVGKYGKGKDGMEGGKLVMGGRVDFFRKRRGDMQVWVETRKRRDDTFKPPPGIRVT